MISARHCASKNSSLSSVVVANFEDDESWEEEEEDDYELLVNSLCFVLVDSIIVWAFRLANYARIFLWSTTVV